MSDIYRQIYTFTLNESPKKLELDPRGTFKSTKNIARIMREFELDPNLRVMYCSETYGNALKYLGAVKRQYEENQDFRKVFGERVSKRGWKEEEINLATRTDFTQKEPNFFCSGVDQTRVGFHCDRLYIDDLVSQQNTRTAKMIERVIECLGLWFSILDPGGKAYITGTRYLENDAYGHVIRNMAKDFDILITDAEPDDGSYPFASAGLTKEFLEGQKRLQGSYVYSCQYRNKPVTPEAALFKREQVRIIPAYDIPAKENLDIYLLTDSASKKDGGDKRVVCAVGKDWKDRAFVLEARMGQWSPYEYIKHLIAVYVKWHCKWGLMEKIGLNEVYREMIAKESEGLREKVKIKPVEGRSTETKERRIQSLQGRMETGTLLFSDEITRVHPDLLRIEAGRAFGLIAEQFVNITLEGTTRGTGDDFPDCLSDIDKSDSYGMPLCPSPRPKPIAPKPVTSINGVPQVTAAVMRPQNGNNFWGELRNISDKNRG